MREREGVFPKSDLHRLADHANENDNYIACLFILQAAYSDRP